MTIRANHTTCKSARKLWNTVKNTHTVLAPFGLKDVDRDPFHKIPTLDNDSKALKKKGPILRCAVHNATPTPHFIANVSRRCAKKVDNFFKKMNRKVRYIQETG